MPYSQHREESVIASVTSDIVCGKFLDIGAADGRNFSNTLALVERGWSGVLVEPEPSSFRALLLRHGDNPKLSLVNAAVACNRGFAKFWRSSLSWSIAHEESDKAGNEWTQISTTVPEHVDKWRATGRFHCPYWILQVGLQELLDQFPPPYDVVSIDTEGTSSALFFQLMQLLPLMRVALPRIAVVEHDGHEQGCIVVAGAKYEIRERNSENLVFVLRRDRL